jgi:hypothetical protein
MNDLTYLSGEDAALTLLGAEPVAVKSRRTCLHLFRGIP